jgi:hypothetical protein
MSSKHTPGPWEVGGLQQLGKTKGPRVFHKESNVTIAVVVSGGGRTEANARLIATAHDLLNACRAVVDAWEGGDLAAAARECQAAIDAAEGRDA